MESRRIQRVGSRSYSITLPKEWVKAAGLKEQSLVFLEQGGDGSLVVSRGEQPKPERQELAVSIKEIDSLTEFIVLCYLKNLKKLRITGRLDYHQAATIKQVLRYLEGYEVTVEDEASIEISFLFRDVDITIPVIIQRMVYLIKLMLPSLERRELEDLEEFENGLDRLHHLSKRILGCCSHDLLARKENRIGSTDQLFFYRAISKRLERIGDQLYKLRKARLSPSDFARLKELLRLFDQIAKTKIPILELKESFEKLRDKNRSKNADVERVYELLEDILENHLSIEYDRRFFL